MRILTAPGVAGIAVVAFDQEQRDLALASAGVAADDPWLTSAVPAPRRALLRLGDRVVDDVLLVPRSDGSLEVHLHGAPAVLAALEHCFGGRYEVPQSAAAQLLRGALGPQQLALALEQSSPGFAASLAAVLAGPAALRQGALMAAIERSRIAEAMVSPVRVVLVGRQNAGKSTLFNSLLQRERALTGARPGVTRDPIAEVTMLDGYPCELIDTAGEGNAGDSVDRAAIAAARAACVGAIVVLVVECARVLDHVDLAAMVAADLVIASKRDLLRAGAALEWPRTPDALVAAPDDEPGALRVGLGRLLRQLRGLPPAGPVGGFAALDRSEGERLSQALAGS